MEKLTALLELFKKLMNSKFTGQLRLNFHKGDLSEKVEKKESIKLDN